MAARRQPNPFSESVDNYLKAILALAGSEGKRATSTALAGRLGVTPASVTNMLQKLAALPTPLVEYERHHGVLLSPVGKRRALEILRHHRLIETFLFKMLDYPLEEVHEEAERLEHFISERFEQRIAAKLGNPAIDPHGHDIPAMDGKMPAQTSRPLAEMRELGEFVVASISDSDAKRLKLLTECGIGPGVPLEVKASPMENGYSVKVGRSAKTIHLSHDAARAIRVQPPRSTSPASRAG